MKGFIKFAILLSCSLLVFSCKSSRLARNAEEELRQYITLSSNPIGGGEINGLETKYKSKNLCILGVEAKTSNTFFKQAHDISAAEYIFYKDADKQCYGCLNVAEKVFLDEDGWQEACKDKIYASAAYDAAIAQRAVSLINAKGYCVADHDAEFHLYVPGTAGDFQLADIDGQFLEQSSGKCITLDSRGTFSCEMTKGSNLNVNLFVTGDAVSMRFTEFQTMVNRNDEPIELVATCADGSESKFDVRNCNSGYTRLDALQSAEFIELLKKGGKIDFVGKLIDATYNFSLNADGFNQAISAL